MMMTTVYLTTQPANVVDPVTIVIPIRWMHELRKELGDEAFQILMIMSFDTSDTGIEWNDYGVDRPSSGHNADAMEQAAWFNALMDLMGDVSPPIREDRIRELVPEEVLNGWDIMIGSEQHELWMNMLDEFSKVDELVIFTNFPDLKTARDTLIDNDKSIKFEELVNDAYGFRGSWNSGWAETLLKDTGHLPKGWYKMNYFSAIGGFPQSLNYSKLKV
jgi:hypothetical protein